MTKVTLLFAALLIFSASSARAADYPVLASYGELAGQLLARTNAVATAEDALGVQASTRDLVKLGVEMMELYASKNPNCKAQFDQFIAEIPSMESMSLEAIHTRYHDGQGLPAAPRHCYFGRSQIVHPVLNIVRLNAPWSDRIRQDVANDFDEVIQHLKAIQRNLDTPPN